MSGKKAASIYDCHLFLTWLYAEYHLYVYKLAWQYCNDADYIEDFVQDIWLSLCAHPEKLSTLNKAQQLAYISATIRNAGASLARSVTYEVALTDAYGITYNEAEILNGIFDRKTSIQQFRKIWPRVPQPAREILERKYLLNQSDAEIARTLGIRTNSVRMYISRAKKTAFSVLSEYRDLLI